MRQATRRHGRGTRFVDGCRPCAAERLEGRRLLSAAVNVTVHHGDAANDGANVAETVLSPTDVNAADFGKRFSTAVDGVVTAQPLYVQDVDVTRGASVGVHSVLYVATEHDSLYAIDANTGAVLWQDSFLNTADPTKPTATAGVTTMPAGEVGDNAGPELGIWSTPAIDSARGEVFLNADTQEVRGSDLHFVQRVWAVRLTDGTPVVAPAVVGDTISNNPRLAFTGYTYVAGPVVQGSGNNRTPTTYPNTDGWAAAPGGATTPVIAFNALVQGGRPGLTLMGGNVYLAFSAHVDQSPYYGWILGYSESTLALTAAFVTTPTYEGIVTNSTAYTAQGGIWSAGSALATDGTSLYVPTSPGAFNVAPGNFNAAGFPIDHDYADSLLKLQVDPASSPAHQNGNGWGLKVADYFTPSNAYELGQKNLDLGSGGATLLPAAITDQAGDPLLVIGGKESRLYVLDRDNLGKFNPAYPATGSADPRAYDHAVNEYAADGVDGTAQGMFDAPAVLNGTVYVGQAYAPGLAFSAAALATGQPPTPTSTSPAAGYVGPTYTATADGTADGLLWATDSTHSDLVAYSAADLAAPLYTSNVVAGDAYAGAVKFGLPTVANGMAYVAGTADVVVGYGLRAAYLASTAGAFAAPTQLAVSFATPADARLGWTTHSALATEFRVDRSTDGKAWTTVALVTGVTTGYDDATVAPGTAYQYRVVAVSGASVTAASNTAVLTPPLSGTVIGTAGSYQNDGDTTAKAFDGNLGTFFDAPAANGNWAGLDLGGPHTISAVAYASRSGWAGRMNGGTFQGSNTADFSAGVTTLFTIGPNANPSSTALTTQAVADAGTFRYVRYLSPNGGYGNVAELQFFGTPAAAHQLSGTAFGTAGSYQNDGNTIADVFDGNLNTFFDGPTANGDVVGLDLGTAAVVQRIGYAPRSGWAGRMVGGVFQGSNAADFSAGVATLYTVSAAPPVGTLTTVTLSNTAGFRYVRYLAPAGSYGDVAEVTLFGTG